MSDEQHKNDDTEVEGHGNRAGVQEEPLEDAEDEFEAHIKVPSVRMD